MKTITILVERKPWKRGDIIAFTQNVIISDTSIFYGAYLRNIAREMKGRLLRVAGKGRGIGVYFESTTV